MTIERNEKLEDSLLEKMSSVDLKKTDNWNKAMILNSAAKFILLQKREVWRVSCKKALINAVTAVSKKDLQEMIMI